MSLTDVQTILGHAWVTSTQVYLVPRDAELFARAQAHFQRLRDRVKNLGQPKVAAMPGHTIEYDHGEMDELFGRTW